MATDVPQRQLRNSTADLLRRVERGERLRITVQGHPVADLVPVDDAQPFVPYAAVAEGLRGLMSPDDRLDRDLRDVDDEPLQPF
jgi:prevent-host-death family protein